MQVEEEIQVWDENMGLAEKQRRKTWMEIKPLGFTSKTTIDGREKLFISREKTLRPIPRFFNLGGEMLITYCNALPCAL